MSDIITRHIYDDKGKVIGQVTGRKEHVNRYSNRDLANEIKTGNTKQKEIIQRDKIKWK